MYSTVLALLFSVIIGCSSDKPVGTTQAEVLYKEAKSLVDDGRYLLATERLNLLKSKYPYSYYATHAELLLADILFNQQSYVESAAAYILFKDFHPKHQRMDYVYFKIAESYFFQLPDTFDRDLSAGKEAIKYYQDLLFLYPNSEYTKNAQDKITQTESMIEKKERYIADFYYKTEVFDSARYHYLTILEDFKTKKLREHSMSRIVSSSYYLKEKDKCLEYYKRYINFISDENVKQKTQSYFSRCENL